MQADYTAFADLYYRRFREGYQDVLDTDPKAVAANLRILAEEASE